MVGPWVGLTSRSPPTPTQEKVKERRERIMVEFEKTGLFLMVPGESHGQRSLEGYSPWGQEELDRGGAEGWPCIFYALCALAGTWPL